jgi:hypothetical protein
MVAIPAHPSRDQNSRAAGRLDRDDQALRKLLGGISRSLKQDAEWQMELLDEARKPVFKIRLVAETLG